MPMQRSDGTLVTRREMGNVAPCRMRGMGCDKGTPEDQRQWSDKNREAYEHWLQARAVGFTDEEKNDPIVRRNAAILEQEQAAHERQFWTKFRTSALEMLGVQSAIGTLRGDQ